VVNWQVVKIPRYEIEDGALFLTRSRDIHVLPVTQLPLTQLARLLSLIHHSQMFVGRFGWKVCALAA
jgi:hypothetical protein